MFKRIGFKIALQFTACMVGLFFVGGAIAFLTDTQAIQRRVDARMEERLTEIANIIAEGPLDSNRVIAAIPETLRPRMRVLTSEGNIVFAGELFTTVPVSDLWQRSADITLGEDQYQLYTIPILLQEDERIGIVQLLGDWQLIREEMPNRFRLQIPILASVALLIFLIAWLFTKRSLRPAEESMKRLEQFTQDASHELRTPLAAAQSSLELALKTKNFERGVRTAHEDLSRVTDLIQHLFALSRLQGKSLKLKLCDISLLTKEVVEEYTSSAKKKGVDLHTDITPHVSSNCDAVLVHQLIGNLLSNAIKFNGKGGKVTIQLEKDTLLISDNGIGIDSKKLPHIFDRFYQADAARAGEGFGLGLSLVQKIADLHGWKLNVVSNKGKGTAFNVRFT